MGIAVPIADSRAFPISPRFHGQALPRTASGPRGGCRMDLNRFTQMAQECLVGAGRKAARGGQQQADVEHLLATMLEQDNGLAPRVLQKAGVEVQSLKGRLQQELDRLPKVSSGNLESGQVPISGRLGRVLDRAEEEA